MEELSAVAVHSAEQELKRGVHTIERWIAGARESETQRQQRLAELEQAELQSLAELQQSSFAEERKELAKEVRELLYYVKQRSTYRFGELYNAAFNPSAFRESTNDRALLQGAWRELLRMIAFDLSQEALATTLRVENAINKLAAKRYREWGMQVADRLDGFEPEPYEAKRFPTPEAAAEQTLEADVPEKLLTSHYKNAKQFFEGDGKSKLRIELEAQLNAPMQSWLERETERLTAVYDGELTAWLQEQLDKQETALREHAEGLRDALRMNINISELAQTKAELEALL